jgi:hypothetical protein
MTGMTRSGGAHRLRKRAGNYGEDCTARDGGYARNAAFLVKISDCTLESCV